MITTMKAKTKKPILVNPRLKKYLDDLDSRLEPLDDLTIAEKIKEILTSREKTITDRKSVV